MYVKKSDNKRAKMTLGRSPKEKANVKLWIWGKVKFDQIGLILKQEGPEGPGTLTWDRRFLKVPFFHC